ncbi:TPA: glycosyltransferase family 2 protein [Streptococcus suis]|nr:glycosyltransferase family 2 protein [Streptococcus suis]
MLTPEVTVIIPVFNAEKSIEKCYNSIQKQTFQDYEILLVNDGSTDNTESLLATIAKSDSKVRVINKKNEGVAVTRNFAVLEAKGKYILFMDNDDFIDSDYIEKFYNAISGKKLDVVVGGYRRVSEEKTLFEVSLKKDSWSKYTTISPWAKIYRKDFIIDNELQFLDYIIGEDVYFNLQVYSLTKKISTIDYVGYNWFDNIESISNTAHKGFKKEADITYLFSMLNKKIKLDDSLTKYYLKRFYIYYLLYSGRTATYQDFLFEYKKIKGWLVEHSLLSNLSPFNKTVSSDRLSVKLIVFAFELIESLKMINLFARIYCKGEQSNG